MDLHNHQHIQFLPQDRITYMHGECPKNDTRGCIPLVQPGRYHGRIVNDGGAAHHGGVDRRSERTDL